MSETEGFKCPRCGSTRLPHDCEPFWGLPVVVDDRVDGIEFRSNPSSDLGDQVTVSESKLSELVGKVVALEMENARLHKALKLTGKGGVGFFNDLRQARMAAEARVEKLEETARDLYEATRPREVPVGAYYERIKDARDALRALLKDGER